VVDHVDPQKVGVLESILRIRFRPLFE
jgi:hypothetical protein